MLSLRKLIEKYPEVSGSDEFKKICENMVKRERIEPSFRIGIAPPIYEESEEVFIYFSGVDIGGEGLEFISLDPFETFVDEYIDVREGLSDVFTEEELFVFILKFLKEHGETNEERRENLEIAIELLA